MEGLQAANEALKGGRVSDKQAQDLIARPAKFGNAIRDASEVHDFLHAMLAHLQLAQVDPVQYVPVVPKKMAWLLHSRSCC